VAASMSKSGKCASIVVAIMVVGEWQLGCTGGFFARLVVAEMVRWKLLYYAATLAIYYCEKVAASMGWWWLLCLCSWKKQDLSNCRPQLVTEDTRKMGTTLSLR